MLVLFPANALLACSGTGATTTAPDGSGGRQGGVGGLATGAGGSGTGGVAGQDAAIDGGAPNGGGGHADAAADRGAADVADARAADSRAPDAGSAVDVRTDADANQPPITIWLAGDSTVQDYPAGNTEGDNGTTLEGWGQELAPFFNPRVTVNNQAIGGRSVAFFMWSVQRDSAGNYLCVDDQGDPNYQLDANGNHVDTSQWARIKAGIKPGDFLLIQFGTNDETHTCPRFVSLPDFQTDFGIMADTVRALGATPIFVTPMSHRIFVGSTISNTLLPYANAMKTEATLKSVEVEDLNLRSVAYFNMVGDTFLATNIFDTGITHFIKPGAIKMAELVTDEIRAHNGPLAAYLK